MIGLIGIKEGMTQVFSEEGNIIPATIIRIEKNIVINRRLDDKDGYSALVIGTVDTKENKLSKPVRGQFKEDLTPKKYLKEFRVENSENYTVGQEIGLDIFDKVKFIDVVGVSKGKGFQGVIKRHHFHGGPKTHGSKFHRQNGSTGQNTFPSHVFKNLKRAGRMGNEQITVQNLKIVEIDSSSNVIIVKGCIPGKNKQLVYITKSLKKAG